MASVESGEHPPSLGIGPCFRMRVRPLASLLCSRFSSRVGRTAGRRPPALVLKQLSMPAEVTASWLGSLEVLGYCDGSFMSMSSVTAVVAPPPSDVVYGRTNANEQ